MVNPFLSASPSDLASNFSALQPLLQIPAHMRECYSDGGARRTPSSPHSVPPPPHRGPQGPFGTQWNQFTMWAFYVLSLCLLNITSHFQNSPFCTRMCDEVVSLIPRSFVSSFQQVGSHSFGKSINMHNHYSQLQCSLMKPRTNSYIVVI